MRIDCHLHTARYSPCSRLEPFTACQRALERGLDAVVITEHQRQWPADELADLRRRFPDLSLFNGFEATLENGVDLVVLTEDRGIEVPFGLSPERFFASDWLDLEGSYFFIAHLFRWSTHPPHGLEHLLPFIHGLEMNSVNILRGQFRIRQGRYAPKAEAVYERTRDRNGLQGIYNSDAHEPEAVGSIANHIPCPRPPASEAELASLLKRSNAEEHQDPELLRNLLTTRHPL